MNKEAVQAESHSIQNVLFLFFVYVYHWKQSNLDIKISFNNSQNVTAIHKLSLIIYFN